MAKYDELISTYSEEIERIKSLQEQYDEANREYNDWSVSQNYDNYDFGREAELAENLGQISQALHSEHQALSLKVEDEYWDVPFEKPRKQGIAKFWEKAGI